MATETPSGIVLLESPVSSYVQKVKIVLREKGIPFTTKVPEDLSNNVISGPLRAANPRVEVPVLIDGDLEIFDSTIILEYLEDKWPSPALLPKDPASRARARMIEEICDTEYEAINWGVAEVRWFKRAEGVLAEELERNGKHHVEVIQQWLTEKLGASPWFGGDSFDWADAAVAPIVNRSTTLGLGPALNTPLAAWHVRLKQRPSVAQTFKEYEEGLPGMQVIVKHIQAGERRREYRSQRLEWMIKSGGLSVVAEGITRNNIRFTWPDNQ
ncbi:hypothetical protein LTR64_005934 [Lithohypha guttulata]|uniref:uncharacterized protein n=1 Tax=Lithohypha guttulata TaxID=1690604 RepID=UPI002DE1A408|nr:hypothetical protein LTR51_002269 [Lithohypha guttulata]